MRGRDLNPRPLGYEPNELPDCSTPRQEDQENTDASMRFLAGSTDARLLAQAPWFVVEHQDPLAWSDEPELAASNFLDSTGILAKAPGSLAQDVVFGPEAVDVIDELPVLASRPQGIDESIVSNECVDHQDARPKEGHPPD